MTVEVQRQQGLASVTVAAKFLAIKRDTLYRLIRSGEVPHRTIGRSIRVSWEWLYAQTEFGDTTAKAGEA